jgi:hypothetical protein
MALDEQVDRSSQAESGKYEKQNQVHRFVTYGQARL